MTDPRPEAVRAEAAPPAAAHEEAVHAEIIRRRYLLPFEAEIFASRPLGVRVAVEFIGTFLLVTVAAGAGVIDHYAGGNQISRAAAVVAPGALVMALIYALGPLSGLHINPVVTLAFAARRVFRPAWILPYWVAQFAGAITAAVFLQLMFGNVSTGGNYPIDKPGGDWRALVMEILLTAMLVSVILHTATGHKSIGHNAAIAVGATIALLGLFASPISGASMNPARTLGPDIVGGTFSGWWVYVIGDCAGAALAVILIGLVRGMPTRSERGAAEGTIYPE